MTMKTISLDQTIAEQKICPKCDLSLTLGLVYADFAVSSGPIFKTPDGPPHLYWLHKNCLLAMSPDERTAFNKTLLLGAIK